MVKFMNKLSWYEAYTTSLSLNEAQMTKKAEIKENLSDEDESDEIQIIKN